MVNKSAYFCFMSFPHLFTHRPIPSCFLINLWELFKKKLWIFAFKYVFEYASQNVFSLKICISECTCSIYALWHITISRFAELRTAYKHSVSEKSEGQIADLHICIDEKIWSVWRGICRHRIPEVFLDQRIVYLATKPEFRSSIPYCTSWMKSQPA